jgi:hypothetical protein
MAYQSVEKAEIKATVESGVTEKELQKIKHIAYYWDRKAMTPQSKR